MVPALNNMHQPGLKPINQPVLAVDATRPVPRVIVFQRFGLAGELEHGAIWHKAGGWAMRAVLGEPKAIVPAAKAVASTGYRLMVPLHYIHACYVRSHYNSMEIGIQDAPRPKEILYALVMGTGGRVHERLGGLRKENIAGLDGQR